MARDPSDPGTCELKFAPKRAPKKRAIAEAVQGQRIGYARKSKDEQDLALQVDALKRAGCTKIYIEQVSRAGPRREKKGTAELDHALMALRPGDTLVVWRLDRLAGSVSELIRIVTKDLSDRGAQFESLTEKIDTGTAAGNMFFQICAVFAEYERNVLIERTHAGLRAARARGRKGGRPKAMTALDIRQAKAMLADGNVTVVECAAKFGVSRTTLYNNVGAVTPAAKKETRP